jgi:hypothetical protein
MDEGYRSGRSLCRMSAAMLHSLRIDSALEIRAQDAVYFWTLASGSYIQFSINGFGRAFGARAEVVVC